MKKAILVLFFTSFSLFAQNAVEVLGAYYLNIGDEIYHKMDVSNLKEGDVIDITGKKNKSVHIKAEVKKLMKNSAILKVLSK